MYICSECGLKFKNKIEYCDCGNDTFEYIEDKPTKITSEQKTELISKLFFILCLILAVLVWFIPIETNASPTTDIKKQEIVKKNIPDINTIWDDTPPSKPKVEPVQEEFFIPLPPKKNIVQPKPSTETQKVVIQPKASKPTQTKVEPIEQPQKQPIKNTSDIKQEKPKQEVKEIIQQPKKPSYNPNSPEMIRYKTNLRAALFSKFAVGSIQGSGSCEIQFSIDKNGKLINRKFLRESDNKTLNDTVYYMLMSVPHFSPPPSNYTGEAIHMTFSINNGNYEISIY